ncbi:hypothetical protein [Antarctobacter jejuensis]
MRAVAILALLALAACGADGEPERPPAKTGFTVTGTAEVGVQVRN